MAKKKLVAVDLFCGGGGTSTGMMMAAQMLGYNNIDLTAVNHWNTALETHSANHPDARHLCERLESLQPERIVPGGRADMLWASPECIHHSKARGGKPMNDQSRSQAWVVLDWVQRLQPKSVLIENVPEFSEWGPLYVSGKNANKPIPSKRGEIFKAWVAALESHGYKTNWRFLTCADYGDATTRRRFFLVAKRGNRMPSLPVPTHAMNGDKNLFNETKPWIPARDIIDWNNPGHSIFLSREDVRKAKLRAQRPLSQNTIKRIEAGIKKYWGEWAKPFLIVLNGGGWSEKPLKINAPVPTIVSGGMHVGLVNPVLVRFNGSHSGKNDGDNRLHEINNPIPAQDTSNRYGIIQPFILGQHSGGAARGVNNAPSMTVATHGAIQICQPFIMATGQTGGGDRCRSITEPLSTLVTKAEHYSIRPFIVKYYGNGQNIIDLQSPLDTVTTDDRFGLVNPVLVEIGGERYLLDILFRMLTPAELAAAHSFPIDYKWCGNKSDIVKQIGNSVPVKTALALCFSQLAA